VVNPVPTSGGRAFGGCPGADAAPLHGSSRLHLLCIRADGDNAGRARVQVMWNEATDTMDSNRSADIVRMSDTAFAGFVPGKPDFRPADAPPG
jgi:putative glutathione S-transferase